MKAGERCDECGCDIIECPECGYRECSDCGNWDVLGACAGNVFCNQCHREFDQSTGEFHWTG